MIHILSDSEFSMVTKVIASLLGLHFPIERKEILSRSISHAAKELGFNRISDFLKLLSSGLLRNDQIEVMASHLTISETYFWREPDVFNALTENVVRELADSQRVNGKNIRIWCAACSTGEEAYSLAIAICRTIPKIKDWNITILATDINPKALSIAKKGVYGSWSFRNSPSWFKDFYFTKLNNREREYEIIPEIKAMVTFSIFNLNHNPYLTTICKNNKLDIIFCRNVLMYFTREWAEKVSRNLIESLSEEGWLVVSSCELSSSLFPRLTTVNFPGAVLYRKTDKEFKVPSVPVFYDTPIRQLAEKRVAKPDFIPLVPKPDKPVGATPPYSVSDKISTIRSLADKGELAIALTLINEEITIHKLAHGLYFLRASIFQELNKTTEAINSLKQAIYMYPKYIMGHFTIGTLLIRQGNMKNALRHFNIALELLSQTSNGELPAESEGLTASFLREVILTSLQQQKPK